MKKFALSLFGFAALAAHSHAAALVAIGAAQLTLENGDPLPDGTLIQVVASLQDNSFSSPSADSFVGGSVDDIVVASFLLNSASFGSPGGFVETITLDYTAGFYGGQTLAANDPLILRWWPSKNLSSLSPIADSRFGEFRTDSSPDGSSRGWTVPADGATESLNLLTVSAGGSQPNTAGRAANIVPVPEPATAVFIAAGAFGLLLRRRRD